MDQHIVQQLLQLNAQFYDSVAEPFAASRHQAWEGWQQLQMQGWLPTPTEVSHILDLGCGNGRFLQFLATITQAGISEQVVPLNISYVGVDQNHFLLDKAQAIQPPLGLKSRFILADLFSQPLSLAHLLPSPPFDLIVLFGVLHHLPGQQLRHELFTQLHQFLKPGGKIIFTTWLFKDNPRLQNKVVDPTQVGLQPSDLEENDFILDWQRQTSAYRYCHYYPESEIQQLLSDTAWQMQAKFVADGHNHHTNRYYLITQRS